jgi:Holliday junction DNA helicase RuvA
VIAYLRGNLLGIIEENKVLLEVQGIGYEITVPVGLLHKLPAPGPMLFWGWFAI